MDSTNAMKYINSHRVLFVTRDIAGAYCYLDALELQDLCTITIPAIDNSLAKAVVAFLDGIVLNLHITTELSEELELINSSSILSQLPVAILLPYCEKALTRYEQQFHHPIYDYTTVPADFAAQFRASMAPDKKRKFHAL